MTHLPETADGTATGRTASGATDGGGGTLTCLRLRMREKTNRLKKHSAQGHQHPAQLVAEHLDGGAGGPDMGVSGRI